MRLRNLLAVVLVAALPLACATAPQTAENSPERAVEDAFLAYKEALLSRDGDTAADLVTEDSWDYYRDMADEALTANRKRLQAMDFSDRVTALLFRHGLTREELRRLSGQELLAASVGHGWFSKDSTARLKLTGYKILGDTAEAVTLGRDGKPSKATLGFARERGGWRLDLLGVVNASRKAMKLAILLSGMNEDELLFATLELGTGRKPGPEIWNPPI